MILEAVALKIAKEEAESRKEQEKKSWKQDKSKLDEYR